MRRAGRSPRAPGATCTRAARSQLTAFRSRHRSARTRPCWCRCRRVPTRSSCSCSWWSPWTPAAAPRRTVCTTQTMSVGDEGAPECARACVCVCVCACACVRGRVRRREARGRVHCFLTHGAPQQLGGAGGQALGRGDVHPRRAVGRPRARASGTRGRDASARGGRARLRARGAGERWRRRARRRPHARLQHAHLAVARRRPSRAASRARRARRGRRRAVQRRQCELADGWREGRGRWPRLDATIARGAHVAPAGVPRQPPAVARRDRRRCAARRGSLEVRMRVHPRLQARARAHTQARTHTHTHTLDSALTTCLARRRLSRSLARTRRRRSHSRDTRGSRYAAAPRRVRRASEDVLAHPASRRRGGVDASHAHAHAHAHTHARACLWQRRHGGGAEDERERERARRAGRAPALLPGALPSGVG